MTDFNKASSAQKVMTMWLVWFSIPMGLVIMQKFAAPKTEVDPSEVIDGFSVFGLFGLMFIFAAAVVRWLVIPRINNMSAGLVAMVVGLGLSEFPGILSMFVVSPEYVNERKILFALAYASALTFAPVYAKRLCAGPTPPPLS